LHLNTLVFLVISGLIGGREFGAYKESFHLSQTFNFNQASRFKLKLASQQVGSCR
jgi:hypothetical protein